MDLQDFITPDICTLVETKYGPMYLVDLALLIRSLRQKARAKKNPPAKMLAIIKQSTPAPSIEGVIFQIRHNHAKRSAVIWGKVYSLKGVINEDSSD